MGPAEQQRALRALPRGGGKTKVRAVEGIVRAIGGLIQAITASKRSAALTLLVALAGALACGWWGSAIRIDTNLTALLPKDAPSVRALDELKARKGSTEMFTLAIEADDDVQREQLVQAFAEEIGSWDETLELYTGRDYTPLRDRALYFLDVEQLTELRDELVAERQKAVANSVGAGLGVGEGPVDAAAVMVGEDDWDSEFEDEEPAGEAAAPPPDAKPKKKISEWFNEQKERIRDKSPLSERELDLIWPKHDAREQLVWEETVGQPYVSQDGRVRVIKASLSKPPTDISFARSLSDRVAQRIDELEARGLMAGAQAQVVSAYNVSSEINVILVDAKRASIVSGLAVVLVLALGFRRVRSLALVLLPMVAATGYTLACSRMLVGELNALTVFLFAVLFGMGVDFAVHLYALRRHDDQASWRHIIESHLRPLASTMLTTSGALAILLVAEFKAFREFGMISAVGVFLCFACAVVLVPAIDCLLPGSESSKGEQPPATTPRQRPSKATPKLGRWLLLAAIAALAAYGGPQLEFEKDLQQLTAPKATSSGISYGSATGRCSKSTVLVAETPAALDTVVARFEAERDQGNKLVNGAPMPPGKTEADRKAFVRDVYALSTLLPPRGEEKKAILDQIAKQANDALAELDPDDPADDERRTHLEALEKLSTASPMTSRLLPRWAREPFVERDGVEGRLAHLCVRMNSKHLDDLVAATARLDEVIGDEAVLRADSRLVFADLISAMQRDAQRLPLWALGVILALIAFDLRALEATLACFGALALGLGLSIAFMGLWPLHLNFFNLVVMPAVIGLSIDASIHLWHARGRETAGATGRASLIAALTTIAGFAGLLVARHPGLRSIGEVGVAAVALCVGVAFLALYQRRS